MSIDGCPFRDPDNPPEVINGKCDCPNDLSDDPCALRCRYRTAFVDSLAVRASFAAKLRKTVHQRLAEA